MSRIALPFVVLAAWLLSACAPPPAGDDGSAESRQLTVLATADVHGRVLPWDYTRGRDDDAHSLLKLASLVDQHRATDAHVLLVDAGDFLQGNPFADHFANDDTRQHPVLAMFDAMAYDAVVLGNHEFDFGLDWLDHQLERTRTPILAGNVLRQDSGEPAYPGLLMRDFDGLRVAVIGLTTPGTAVWNRRHVEGRLDFIDGVDAARPLVERARSEGANVVVAVLHAGLDGANSYSDSEVAEENFGRRLATTVAGIDVLVLAHTHRILAGDTLTGPDGREVAVVQPGRWASHLGVVKLDLQRGERREPWQVRRQPSQVLAAADAPVHETLAAQVAGEHDLVRAWIDTALTTTAEVWDAGQARLGDTPVIDLIQHVQREATGAQLSATAAFNTELRFGPGPVTRAHVASLYPYENTLVVIELSGRQLRDYLEHSARYYAGVVDGEATITEGWPGFNFDIVDGVDYRIDLQRPPGERIVELRWQGAPVADDQRFTMALNSYRAEGAGGYAMLAEAPILSRDPRSIRDLIETWLAQQPELRHDQVFRPNWSLSY